MDIHKIKNLPADELQTLLEGEAQSVEEQVYMRALSDDELALKKDELAQAAIMRAVLEEELRIIKESYKDKMDPVKTQISSTISAIKSKAVEVKGRVYKMPDYDNQMIHIIDPLGNVLSSRRMLPEERQFRISANQKSA